MAKLALAVIVCVVGILAQEQQSFNRHQDWNYTQELQLKERKWSENLTHIFIAKPVPAGFFDAWAHVNPNPCKFDKGCHECVSMPGDVCRFYISRSREVAFCGQRGEYLGCDGFFNLEGLDSPQKCTESGYPSLEYVNEEAPLARTRTRCEFLRTCQECTKHGCSFYTTDDLGYEFCGRAEDWGTYPFSTSRITVLTDCKPQEERSLEEKLNGTTPDPDETSSATAVYLGLALVAAVPILALFVWLSYPEWFVFGSGETVEEGEEMIEVSLCGSTSVQTLTYEAANEPDDIIAMVDANP